MARSGDRIGGTWRLLEQAPSGRGVERWRAVDDGGRVAELLSARTEGAAAPGSIRQQFAVCHDAVAAHRDPAVVRVHEVVRGADAVWVAREPLDDSALDAASPPLPGEIVAAIGARLAAPVAALGGPLGGTLLASDVGIDAAGRPVLAPTLPHATLVERSAVGAVAPELFDGAQPDGRAALFGLGSLLYRLATGRSPPTGTEPPPPSSWNHRIGPELDRAILALLSRDPAKRPAAMADLQRLAAADVDLRPWLAASGSTTSSRPAPVTAVATTRTGGVLVAIPAAEVAGLEPAIRSRVAGVVGLPLSALDAAVAAGLPVAVGREGSVRAARDRARALASELGVAARVASEPALGTIGWSMLTAVAAAVPAGLSVALGLVVGPIAAIPGAAVALAIGLVGALRAAGARSAVAIARAAEEAWRIQEQGRAVRARWSEVAEIDRRIARLRADLGRAALPIAADADVRDALKEVERRVDTLLEVVETAESALARVDRTRLRTRLGALERAVDPEHRVERDRVARTIADLDAVADRRKRHLAEILALGSELDALSASLVREAEAPGSESERLRRVAHVLRMREPES